MRFGKMVFFFFIVERVYLLSFCFCDRFLFFSLPICDFTNFQYFFMERVKFTNEYLFRASPAILYQFLTTPSCLIRWFCDEVDIEKDTFSFFWNGAEEAADLIQDVENELLRFKWEDADDEDEYLEYKITKSPVTGETILEVTDYCDEDEVEDQKALWDSQIQRLRTETGG